MSKDHIRFEISRVKYLIQGKQYWQCYDRRMDVSGVGKNPTEAKEDCQVELEILTSDIHK